MTDLEKLEKIISSLIVMEENALDDCDAAENMESTYHYYLGRLEWYAKGVKDSLAEVIKIVKY